MNPIKILFLILIFSLPLASNAQTYFGVKLGGHLANIDQDSEFDQEVELSSKFGLNIGVYMDVPVSGAFSIQPELNYTSKGTKFQDLFFSAEEEFLLVLNYIDLHLLGKYNFGDEDIKAFVAAGPTYGYIIKGFNKFGDEKEKIEFGDNGDGLKRTEFGFNLGGGVAFPIDFGEITMDVRYLLGLSNLADEDNDEFTLKNKGFGINMGIRLPLSKE